MDSWNNLIDCSVLAQDTIQLNDLLRTAISEPRSTSIGSPYVVWTGWSTYFEALKLRKRRSGSCYCPLAESQHCWPLKRKWQVVIRPPPFQTELIKRSIRWLYVFRATVLTAMALVGCPTDPFTTLELQNQSCDVSEVLKFGDPLILRLLYCERSGRRGNQRWVVSFFEAIYPTKCFTFWCRLVWRKKQFKFGFNWKTIGFVLCLTL